MKPLEFDHRSYHVNGKRLFLVSGEIHYFRTPRSDWRRRLELFKESGGNCVATYVPWLLHEPKEGSFDFQSDHLDVEAFLNLAQDIGLWVLVRPGPYQYSELMYDGLPKWLCEEYTESRAMNLEGKSFRTSSMSYLHPVFMEKTRRWYQKILPRLAKHQTTCGGAVVGVQVDNELMGVHEWFGSWDYNPETYGIGRETGRWPSFLIRRYGTLANVNTSYDIEASSLSEVLPITKITTGTPAKRRRVKDYQDCYFESIAEYVKTLSNWMKEHGIDVPIVHNSANPYMNSYFESTVRTMGDNFILGSDHYYNLNMDWDQNNPTPKYAMKCFYSNEMLRNFGMPPTVYELPGGSLSDFPPITAKDCACCYMTNIAYGMKGFNYYIFTGGSNPPNAGTTGETYDYGAAVSPTGEIRELYYAQQSVNRFLDDFSWLAGAEQIADCQLGLSYEYSRSQYYCGDKFDMPFSTLDAWTFMRKGLMATAFCAGLSPRIVNIESDDLLDNVDLPLMIASSTVMARDVQERITRFLKAGGNVFLAPVLPSMDENFSPCSILAEFIGHVKTKKHEAMAPLLTAYDVPNVFVNGGLFSIIDDSDQSKTTAIEERDGGVTTIGKGWKFSSGGSLSILGFHWKQAKREHEIMLKRALTDLGCTPRIESDNPNVWTVLRGDENRSMLFAMNLFSSSMTTRIRYRDPFEGNWIDLGKQHLPGFSVSAWCEGKKVFPGDTLFD